jgi:septation ring formation regulator EzrA
MPLATIREDIQIIYDTLGLVADDSKNANNKCEETQSQINELKTKIETMKKQMEEEIATVGKIYTEQLEKVLAAQGNLEETIKKLHPPPDEFDFERISTIE